MHYCKALSAIFDTPWNYSFSCIQYFSKACFRKDCAAVLWINVRQSKLLSYWKYPFGWVLAEDNSYRQGKAMIRPGPNKLTICTFVLNALKIQILLRISHRASVLSLVHIVPAIRLRSLGKCPVQVLGRSPLQIPSGSVRVGQIGVFWK